jgi:outer membrane lipoprotein carrier protein
MKRSIPVLIILALSAGVIVRSEETAQDVLERVKNRYDAINDAELKFTQHVRFPLAHIEQDVKGTLYLKKDHRYRVETDDQTIVTDGKTVWSYTPASNQVLVDNFKLDDHAFTPERILVAAPEDFAASLVGRDRIGKTDVVVLKLVPKSEDTFVTSLKLWVSVSDWMMKRVELIDANGKETTYNVTALKTNIGLQDSRFSYQIPKGAEVVDLR